MPEVFNTTDYLVDRHVREGRGARTALVSHRALTYEELSGEVRRVAAGLRALGVRPEERVLMCRVDDVELFTGILAAFRVGAVAVPVSTMLAGGELGKLVADSAAGSCWAPPSSARSSARRSRRRRRWSTSP